MAKQAVAIMVLLPLLLVLSSGCGQSSGNPLLGKWHGVSGPGVADSIQFFKDGTVSTVQYGVPVGGEYSLIDDEHVRVVMSRTYVFRFSVDGSRLTLVDEGGTTFTYQKR